MPESIRFQVVSDYVPQGDQPQAITALVQGIDEGKRKQILLGATGTGKTFTMDPGHSAGAEVRRW